MSKDDSATLVDCQTELDSATRNADKGMMNQEMATALLSDIK